MSVCNKVYPDDVNGAAMLRESLRDAIFFEVDVDYYLHLWILTGLLVLSLVIIIINTELRRKRGLLWPVRWTTTVAGNLINPSPVVLWSLGSFLFLVASIPYIWLARGRGSAGPNIENPIAFRMLIWVPLWMGAWSVVRRCSPLFPPLHLLVPFDRRSLGSLLHLSISSHRLGPQ